MFRLKILDFLVPFAGVLRNLDKKKPFDQLFQVILVALPLTFFITWLFSFIPYGGLIYTIVAIPIAAWEHIKVKNISKDYERIDTFLWYFVVINCGFGSIRNFVGHFFMSDIVAKSIGWETGSHFQIELAFFHLGVGIAALGSIWFRKNLVEGIAVIRIVFLLGAAYVHLKDIIVNSNFSPSNTGVVLAGDLLIPMILIYFLILKYKHRPRA